LLAGQVQRRVVLPHPLGFGDPDIGPGHADQQAAVDVLLQAQPFPADGEQLSQLGLLPLDPRQERSRRVVDLRIADGIRPVPRHELSGQALQCPRIVRPAGHGGAGQHDRQHERGEPSEVRHGRYFLTERRPMPWHPAPGL
jgi:hypothetical protein